jgi:ATP-dependent helicase/DNAse subunit B
MASTTIKLSQATKKRLDNLKQYRRETYEDTLQSLLDLLNLCRVDPLKAQHKLRMLDKPRPHPKTEAL